MYLNVFLWAAVVHAAAYKTAELVSALVKEGAEVTTESVRTQLDGVLARYKLPKNVVVVEDLPRTASGKVRKAALRELFGRKH